MANLKPTLESIEDAMRNTSCIRNVSILAHVDHGKTTVADSLLATNRLVSKRLAGTLRFLDDRRDEQERKITMKSSAVSLLNTITLDDDQHLEAIMLLNIIDTPGHIDFSSEVAAAVRVCDGALILVDVIEGTCVQTREAIKHAFEQKAKMILVINKLDKAITVLRLPIEELFQKICRIIEDCNVIIAELYQFDVANSLEEVDIEDTGLLFSPDTGNVIFSSAVDGWGFTTKQIAQMFHPLIKNETIATLNTKIWDFDNFIDSKTKTIKRGALENKKTNLFIQMCLKTIEYVYTTIVIRMEREKLPNILEKLNIKNVTRDMSHNDTKIQIRAILQGWLPLADTILLQCFKVIPPPNKIETTKIDYLFNTNYHFENSYICKCIQEVTPFLSSCSTGSDAPTILYVSKMFSVSKKNLSQNKPKVFVPGPRPLVRNEIKIEEKEKTSENTSEINENQDENVEIVKSMDEDFITVAFARVFSGNLKVGQELFVLDRTYLPSEDFLTFDDNLANKVQKVTIQQLYMLSGRELIQVDQIPAGNICAISGLESAIIRSATVSTTLSTPPFIEPVPQEPVVRNAIEPKNPRDLPILRLGLKKLMQADSGVQVVTQETGELVLLTAGDVHLAKCLEDLETKFGGIDVNVSDPMVALRETIITPNNFDFNDTSNTIEITAGPFKISVTAVSLPENIAEVIRKNYDFLRMVEEHQSDFVKTDNLIINKETLRHSENKTFKSQAMQNALTRVKSQLSQIFDNEEHWKDLTNNIWSVGKMNDSINLLINNTKSYNASIFETSDDFDLRGTYNYCLVNAFNNSCKAGPLCEEPLMNCAFFVNKYEIVSHEIQGQESVQRLNAQITANIQMVCMSAFREAFQKQTQRLMEPIFTTDIQVNTSILGKVYTVVSKRHGKVLDAVGMDEMEKTFLVKAQIPVVESVGFANEMRKTTSGQAIPSLQFSHYEIIDGDPFYVFTETEDDEEDENINIDSAVRASKLRKDVRRRKGLYVDDQVVVHAEKQRTLNKKK